MVNNGYWWSGFGNYSSRVTWISPNGPSATTGYRRAAANVRPIIFTIFSCHLICWVTLYLTMTAVGSDLQKAYGKSFKPNFTPRQVHKLRQFQHKSWIKQTIKGKLSKILRKLSRSSLKAGWLLLKALQKHDEFWSKLHKSPSKSM